MLHLRVFGDPSTIADVADQLAALPGARHISRTETGSGGTILVSADVSADAALETVARLHVAPGPRLR